MELSRLFNLSAISREGRRLLSCVRRLRGEMSEWRECQCDKACRLSSVTLRVPILVIVFIVTIFYVCGGERVELRDIWGVSVCGFNGGREDAGE